MYLAEIIGRVVEKPHVAIKNNRKDILTAKRLKMSESSFKNCQKMKFKNVFIHFFFSIEYCLWCFLATSEKIWDVGKDLRWALSFFSYGHIYRSKCICAMDIAATVSLRYCVHMFWSRTFEWRILTWDGWLSWLPKTSNATSQVPVSITLSRTKLCQLK